MHWHVSYRADPLARPIADRHYNRQAVGAPQFVPPGGCVVLVTEALDALWVTSLPLARFVKHDSTLYTEDGTPVCIVTSINVTAPVDELVSYDMTVQYTAGPLRQVSIDVKPIDAYDLQTARRLIRGMKNG